MTQFDRAADPRPVSQRVSGISCAADGVSKQHRIKRHARHGPAHRRDWQPSVNELLGRLDVGPVEPLPAYDDHRSDRIAALGGFDCGIFVDQCPDPAAVRSGERPIRLLADECARIGAARSCLSNRGDGIVAAILGCGRDGRRAGQWHDTQIVDLQSARATIAVAGDDELDPARAAQVPVHRRAPCKADLPGRDDHLLPFSRRVIIAPYSPPNIVAVGQLHLQVIAVAPAAHSEANLEIARERDGGLAADIGIARNAAEVVGKFDRATRRAGNGAP